MVIYASDLFSGMAGVHLDLHSDSLEAVNFAKDPYVGSTPSWADKRNIDLKLRLREVMSMTSVNFSFLHVKAHQDDELSYEDLTFPAKLNFHCDATARRHLQALRGPSPTFSLPDNRSSYLSDQDTGGRVSCTFQEAITKRR